MLHRHLLFLYLILSVDMPIYLVDLIVFNNELQENVTIVVPLNNFEGIKNNYFIIIFSIILLASQVHYLDFKNYYAFRYSAR